MHPRIPGEVVDQPASVRSATDAYLQYLVILDGFVVLHVSLNSKGDVTDIHVLRDPGSMVPAAMSSVKTWRFEPAVEAVKSVDSEMTVVFVYRPADYGGSKATLPKPFTAVRPPENSEGSSPAGILSVSLPRVSCQQCRVGLRNNSSESRRIGWSDKYQDRSCTRALYSLCARRIEEVEFFAGNSSR